MTQREFDLQMKEFNSKLKAIGEKHTDKVNEIKLQKFDEVTKEKRQFSANRLVQLSHIADNRAKRNEFVKFTEEWNNYNGAIADCEMEIQRLNRDLECELQDIDRKYMVIADEERKNYYKEYEAIKQQKDDVITTYYSQFKNNQGNE